MSYGTKHGKYVGNEGEKKSYFVENASCHQTKILSRGHNESFSSNRNIPNNVIYSII